MGTADIVPGVSGGTVALVLGIYARLIHNVHAGAQVLRAVLSRDLGLIRTRLAMVQWGWLVSLLIGILTAVAVLSSLLTHLLEEHPVRTAAVFFGLVLGAVVVAWRRMSSVTVANAAAAIAAAAALFLLLGLRSDTESTADEIVTQPWWVFTLSGAVAICSMILPGISGSLILVMLGMYAEVLGAVTERDVVVLAAFAIGCVAGLAAFASVLDRALRRHHDLVMAAMIGLMIGSLRVLWPWPAGTSTTTMSWPRGDVVVPVVLALAGAVVVVVVDLVGQRATRSESREMPSTRSSSPSANENLA